MSLNHTVLPYSLAGREVTVWKGISMRLHAIDMDLWDDCKAFLRCTQARFYVIMGNKSHRAIKEVHNPKTSQNTSIQIYSCGCLVGSSKLNARQSEIGTLI